jgi:restriction endonuclease S subunit
MEKTEFAQISQLIEPKKGKKVKSSKIKTPNSIPYLLIDTLRGDAPEFFTEDKNYVEAIPEDILIVGDGANSGLVGTGVKGAVGSTIIRLRKKVEDLENNYLTYFLKLYFEQLRSDIKGSGTPHLKINKLLKMNIRKPSLQEQTLIVSAIETQFSRLDETIENLKAVKKKIGTYRKSVLKKAFEKKKGWEEKDLPLCFKSVTPTNKIPKSNCLKEGNLSVVDQGEEIIGGYINDISKKQVIDLPVIIFGDHTRRFKYIDFEFVAGADGTKILKVNKNINPKYFYYQTFILEFPNKGYSRHFQYLKKTKLVYPNSLKEQQKIVQEIESKFSVIDKIEQIVEQSLKKAERLRKSILKVAFEGRLVR